MLLVSLLLETSSGTRLLNGHLGNISSLACLSGYAFKFDGRNSPDSLKKYPRWCEPVAGLAARCLALSKPTIESVPVGSWISALLTVGLKPGGRGELKPQSTVFAHQNADGTISVSWEQDKTKGLITDIPVRAAYADAWGIAEHAIRVAIFGADMLPAPVPLDIPVRQEDRLNYVRMRDIPEPTRTAFQQRMAHSTCPVIEDAADAVYAWDWQDFLNGYR